MTEPSAETRHLLWGVDPIVVFLSVGLCTWVLLPAPEGEPGVAAGESAPPAEFDEETERARFQLRRGREPDSGELENLREWHASRQHLLDEAVKMGLHRENTEVETRLLDGLAAVVGGGLREPTAAELKQHYEAHFQNVQEREVDFTWVTLPQTTTPGQVEEWAQQAEDGNVVWSDVGGRPAQIRNARERGLGSRLPLPVVETALSADLNRWVPVPGKTRAVLRITRRETRPVPTLEQIRNRVQEDWKRMERIRHLEAWKEQKQPAGAH